MNLENKLKQETEARKKLHNKIIDMKGNIRVFARIRPFSQTEIAYQYENVVTKVDALHLEVQPRKGPPKKFQFDICFEPSDTQETVFSETKPLIQSALDGYNVCVFAFGQTGSGKTYTMQGGKTEASKGLTPRVVDYLFKLVQRDHAKDENAQISVRCSMIELYRNQLIDLLIPKLSQFDNHQSTFGSNRHNKDVYPPKLEIREDHASGMVFVQNAVSKQAQSPNQLHAIIKSGLKQRERSKTEMSIESSRSHLITTILVQTKSKGEVTMGKISLIDLAGSERMTKSNPTHDQLQEAKAINSSLSALFDVIQKLTTPNPSKRQKHIPYRSDKLTMLMKDSLGGNSKTLMVVNLSPACYNLNESL